MKLVGGGEFLGIEEFSVFKYAFLNSSVGIGKGAFSVPFVILPSTNVLVPIGIGIDPNAIVPVTTFRARR